MAFTGLTIHAKIIGGDVPFYLKFRVKVTALERNFRSVFARSASAVTSSEKSSIKTNIGSPLRAFQRAQDKHRTLSLSPYRVAQKRKVSKI